jgi:hypothetical protein
MGIPYCYWQVLAERCRQVDGAPAVLAPPNEAVETVASLSRFAADAPPISNRGIVAQLRRSDIETGRVYARSEMPG